jgi:hypothetical protein
VFITDIRALEAFALNTLDYPDQEYVYLARRQKMVLRTGLSVPC